MLVVVVELLFTLLFARALAQMFRREPLSGDVALVFCAMSGLFLLTLLGAVLDDVPDVLRALASALLLAQPVFTLRLVARIRRLPRGLLPGAVAAYVATAWPVLLLDRPLPSWAVWLAVSAFAVVELVAAAYLVLEARRRVGAARLRLWGAAVSTALFAVALVVAGTGQSMPARVVALVSAMGYIAAFMPPRSLRRAWAASTALGHVPRLLALSEAADADAAWRRLARVARDVGDVDAAVVLCRTASDQVRLGAASGVDIDEMETSQGLDFDLVARPTRQQVVTGQCPLVQALAAAVGARYSTMVPLPRSAEGPTQQAVLLLARQPSLFNDDDLDVIASLGATAVLVAERAEVTAEQNRMAAKLSSTVEALRVASTAKSDLLARVSHELRTPLTVIIGYCDVLRRVAADGPASVAGEAVQRIDAAGRHLLTLVEEVLDVAKMDAGQIELHAEDVDLVEMIRRLVADIQPLAAHKRLGVSMDVGVTEVYADEQRLRQVLYILASNAVKFTPEGGSVRFSTAEVDGEVRISVTDTGIGIAPEDHSRVFQEFTKVYDKPDPDGTGLGLAIARRLVQAHGGRTELVSAPEKGSTFTVVLPNWHQLVGGGRQG